MIVVAFSGIHIQVNRVFDLETYVENMAGKIHRFTS